MVSASESKQLFQLFSVQAGKIESALAEGNVEKSRCLIQEFQGLITSNAGLLPSRDLQTYGNRIDGYRKKLDEIKAPKKKFAFSKTAKDAHADRIDKPPPAPPAEPTTSVAPPAAVSAPPAEGERAHQQVAKTTVLLEGKHGEELQLDDVRGEVELRNLKECRVVIRGFPETLHMSEIDDCEVICDPVASSVLIVGFRRSSLQVACQQLRVHKAVKATMRLHITSRSIIEDCKDILFGPLSPSYLASEESWLRSGLSRSKNNYSQVDDFDWLNVNQPSPNWKLLE